MKIEVYKFFKGFFFIKILLKYCCKICNKYVFVYNILINLFWDFCMIFEIVIFGLFKYLIFNWGLEGSYGIL